MNNTELVRFEKGGIELYINIQTGESFASKRGYARLANKDESTIRKRCQGAEQGQLLRAEVLTAGGLQGADLITESLICEWLPKDNPEMATKLMQLGVRMFLHTLADYETKPKAISSSNHVKTLSLEQVADSSLKMMTCVEKLENSGDYQLAQLLKSTLGNLIIKETRASQQAEVPQYEGVIDVALKLGFNVPANYEGSLGAFVKKRCGHLLVCHNKRYSVSSHKQIMASMYPANHKEVESAVMDYCVKKAFYHRDIYLPD